MKSLVQSLHSENPLAAGRTNHHQTVPETITEDTDSAPAAAEDIKRLETKVRKENLSIHVATYIHTTSIHTYMYVLTSYKSVYTD